MSRIEEPQHPLLAHRPEEKILAIVLSGERGLAGAFNTNILRKANEFFRANKGKRISTVTIGKKGRDAMKKAGVNIVAEYVNVELHGKSPASLLIFTRRKLLTRCI
jgi:F-type H+-transporting ATPase subunit gamma